MRAERQTEGRGRLGRDWHSLPGNLCASTIVRPQAGDPEASSLALVAGIALHEVACAWAGGVELRLKWPNDLLAGPAKLAGILLERSGDAIVVGFGVNLAHRPEALERQTASYPTLGLAAPGAALFLEDLAGGLARWVRRWRTEGLATVRAAWLAAAHPIGTPLTAGGVDGLFEGLEPDGALRLRRGDGAIDVIRAGDVFLL